MSSKPGARRPIGIARGRPGHPGSRIAVAGPQAPLPWPAPSVAVARAAVRRRALKSSCCHWAALRQPAVTRAIVRQEAAGFGQARRPVRRKIVGDPPRLERRQESADARPGGHAQRQNVVAADRQALRLPSSGSGQRFGERGNGIAAGIGRRDPDQIGIALGAEAVQVARALGRRSPELGQRVRGERKQPVRRRGWTCATGRPPSAAAVRSAGADAAARPAGPGDRCPAPARSAGPGARARPAPGSPRRARRSRPSGAARAGIRRLEQPHHLRLDPLAREAPQFGRGRTAGGERLGVGGRPAVVGEEAEEAQDAQIVLGDARRRGADEADPAGREVRAPAEVVVEPARASQLMALIVKSRRAASRTKSSVNATSAWRPSQATSRRSVVISKRRSSASVVTVPCARPVGIAGRPARSSRRITCSGRSGVAMSSSRPTAGRPSRPSRTQPPTKRARSPSAPSAASTCGWRARAARPARRAGGRAGRPWAQRLTVRPGTIRPSSEMRRDVDLVRRRARQNGPGDQADREQHETGAAEHEPGLLIEIEPARRAVLRQAT